MKLARRQFVELTVALGVGSLIAACSSEDKTSSPDTDAGGNAGRTDAGSKADAGSSGADAGGDASTAVTCRSSITQNHAHTVTIPLEDLPSTTSKTYSIMGGATHNHEITLDAQDFADLRAGLSVKKSSTNFDTHNHDVAILCT